MRPVLTGLVATVSVFLLAEAGARILATVSSDLDRLFRREPEEWFQYSPDLGWVIRKGYSGPIYKTERSYGKLGLLTRDNQQTAQRASHTLLFVGDSNTFGHNLAAEDAYPEATERLLAGTAAINLGVPGYTSFQGREALRRHRPLVRPDVVVISFGFNDRRWVRPGQQDSGGHFTEVAARARRARLDRALRTLYLYRLMGRIMGAAGLRDGPVAEPSGPVDVGTLALRVSPEDYRINLRDMVLMARSLGARAVLLALADNPAQAGEVARAVRLLAAGDVRKAVRILRVAVNRRDTFTPLARLHLSQALEDLGEADWAARIRMEERPFYTLHGGEPLALDQEYAQIMGEVARETGALLVDAGPVLQGRAELFTDMVHFDEEGHRLVAGLLAEAIAPLLDHAGAGHARPD